jgi:hypothetical protein
VWDNENRAIKLATANGRTGEAAEKAFRNFAPLFINNDINNLHPESHNLPDPIFDERLPVTLESTLNETASFLHQTPENSARFLFYGIKAAITITNAYSSKYGTNMTPLTLHRFGLDAP